jgi:hypothetical protein
MKTGSLNLLKPSGPVQACNGIALPLPHTVWMIKRQRIILSHVRGMIDRESYNICEGKISLQNPMLIQKDNIKMDLLNI